MYVTCITNFTVLKNFLTFYVLIRSSIEVFICVLLVKNSYKTQNFCFVDPLA